MRCISCGTESPLFLSQSTRVLISRLQVLSGFELGSVAWDATGGWSGDKSLPHAEGLGVEKRLGLARLVFGRGWIFGQAIASWGDGTPVRQVL